MIKVETKVYIKVRIKAQPDSKQKEVIDIIVLSKRKW